MYKYANVIVKTKTSLADKLFTYKTDEFNEVKPGQRVLVPFGRGNRKEVGVVHSLTNQVDESINYKNIIDTVESEPILNRELLQLAEFMVDTYVSDISSAIRTVLPPGDLVSIKELFYSNEVEDELSSFLSKPKTFEEIKESFPSIRMLDLGEMVESGKLKSMISTDTEKMVKKVRMVNLVSDDMSKIQANANKQREIINHLKRKGKALSQRELLKETSASLSSLKSLENKGLLRIYDKEVFRKVIDKAPLYYSKHKLNAEQEKALDNIINSSKRVSLLKGVTGSGKTEVYLHLVEKAIDEGKKAIVLVPEISLTPQTIERFAGRFGKRVAVLHSALSQAERFDQWRMIKEGIYNIVVGTRSAIFAPLNNIGVIIIDEEHELSYSNEKNPKYDAIDLANFRANYHDCKLVLASATPRVESYYRAQEGKYNLVELKKRVSDKKLPKVIKVDMREELKSGNFSMFSNALREGIEENLNKGKQSILFLNKRGYTSHVFCRKCGYVQKCNACDASMTYHSYKNISICHLCGRTSKKILICPQCGSSAIKEFGAGTQKLEEATRLEFPQARVFRMDADTMTRKGSYEKVYRAMENGQIDILIGTQMISKGFDFKDVDLVGIMSADLSLNLPDFRAGEKTFQLITQVAGRSGRGDNEGKVVIQTYEPNHYAIEASEHHEYEEFYEKEIQLRQKLKYPPFYDMTLIRVSHANKSAAYEKAFSIARDFKDRLDSEDSYVIGPNPPVIEMLNNKFRFNILVKTKDSLDQVRLLLRELNESSHDSYKKGYRIYSMINPISIF